MSEFPQATRIKTQDESSTPNTAPLTVSSSEIVLEVPEGAVEFDYGVENNAIRISEVAGMASYDKIFPGGDKFGCKDMEFIYVKRDGSGDAILNFRFNCN